jgi:hypothetical protein
MIAEKGNLELLIGLRAHVSLVGAMDRFPDSAELVFNCFRILTKMSDRDSVRKEVLGQYPDPGLLVLLLTLMDKHRENMNILSRLFYVFADFAACETAFVAAAGRVTRPVDVAMISDLLESESVRSDRTVAAMAVQVIANLSVDADCAALFMLSNVVPDTMTMCTFGADDRLGFNLLCAGSNFTFHDKAWSPPELIRAIPVAIVSKHVPSIIEALRIVCNLALAPNTMLIETKIPEMLGILLGHVHQDVVLFALQALTNLVNHAGVRRRFREGGGLNALLDMLSADEIDELELEGIAALVVNFGAISIDEASMFASAIEQFEIDGSNHIITNFAVFLDAQLADR